MDERVTQKRWAPRAMVVVLVVLWPVAIVGVAYSYSGEAEFGGRELLSALPLISLLAYGSLAFLLNKTEVYVSGGRLEIRHGPVPTGVKDQPVPLDEIEACYYRRFVVPVKTGTGTFFAAGLRLGNGRSFDILGDFETEGEAKAVAERLARQVSVATGRNVPIDAGGWPHPLDWKQRKGLLIWSGAFIAALLWILVVDALRLWTARS